MNWGRKRKRPAAEQPGDSPPEIDHLPMATCPECASARHTQVLEPTTDGKLQVRRGCLRCGAVWPLPSTDTPDRSDHPLTAKRSQSLQ